MLQAISKLALLKLGYTDLVGAWQFKHPFNQGMIYAFKNQSIVHLQSFFFLSFFLPSIFPSEVNI